ncbi:MAG: lipid II flippase MurJ [Actinomycetota bacterium]
MELTDQRVDGGRHHHRGDGPDRRDRGTESSEQPERGRLGDSGTIAAASAISRVTGLLRILVAASVLGATVFGDLFVAVNVLPLTLYDVFAGSAITSVLVPPLARLLNRGDRQAAHRFVANSLGLICGAMAMVAIGAVLARPLLAGALTAGVDTTLADDATTVGSLLLLLILPQLVLYAAIGVFVSVQHAHHRFLVPSAAPIVENLGLIATIAVAWWRFGGGIEVDRAPTALILTLAIGSGLSVSAHAFIQFLGARAATGSIRIGVDIRDAEIRRLAGPARASFGWSTIIAVRQFALVVAAAFAGAGGVQAFEIAVLAYFVPMALIGRPIASAALPRLATTRGTTAGLHRYLDALRVAAWTAVPAGLALAALSGAFASVIARGEFDRPESVTLLTYGLAGLGVGAAADALFEVARQATMALERNRTSETPVGDGATTSTGIGRSNWLRAAVAAVGIPAVVLLLDGPVVLLALGLVVSVGDLLALAIVHRALRSMAEWPTDTGTSHWPRILIATTVGLGLPVGAATAIGVDWTPLTVIGLVMAVAIAYSAAAVATTGRGTALRDLLGRVQGGDGRPTEVPT